MILDTLQNRERYYALAPRLRKAFEWLDTADITSLEVGRHDIDGDDIVNIIAINIIIFSVVYAVTIDIFILIIWNTVTVSIWVV